jgi:hypothetical protein
MAVGAFAETVIRGFFAYHPDAVWPSTFTQKALDGMLLTSAPRGFVGKLSNIKTPFGLVTITSSEVGLSIALQ